MDITRWSIPKSDWLYPLQPKMELIHWKRPWCWEGLGAGGEGDDRGWDGWMASPTRWTWVWVNSRSWWWTRRPGVLRFMGLQRVGHDWAVELKWGTKRKIQRENDKKLLINSIWIPVALPSLFVPEPTDNLLWPGKFEPFINWDTPGLSFSVHFP